MLTLYANVTTALAAPSREAYPVLKPQQGPVLI